MNRQRWHALGLSRPCSRLGLISSHTPIGDARTGSTRLGSSWRPTTRMRHETFCLLHIAHRRRSFNSMRSLSRRWKTWCVSTRPFEARVEEMEIKRNGSQPSNKGPSDYFTGTVRVDPLFQAHDPARAVGASVTFEPGARTAWHTHPLGQTLIVTAGCGLAQSWGGAIEEIRPGDVVWFPPGEKNWHGAAPTTAMTHIAIQEQLDGKTVDWMEKVSDEQYGLVGAGGITVPVKRG